MSFAVRMPSVIPDETQDVVETLGGRVISTEFAGLSFVSFLRRKLFSLSRNEKIVVFSAAAGIAVIGFLARYLRRRRVTPRQSLYQKISRRARSNHNKDIMESNIFLLDYPRSDSPTTRRRPHSSQAFSDKHSMASGMSTMSSNAPLPPGYSLDGIESENTSPQQFGVMGMEALETAIRFWERALSKYQNATLSPHDKMDKVLALLEPEEAKFCHNLQQILDVGYALQENCELLFLDHSSVLFKPDSVGSEHSKHTVDQSAEKSSASSKSSVASFLSARSHVADLRDFDEFADDFPNIDQLKLYQAALKQREELEIPVRKMRTELVKCGSDVEYLAKLHCVRLAYQYMFLDPENKILFIDNGRQIITNLLLYADRDPKDFLIAYENMFDYLSNGSWDLTVTELTTRDVKAMTFYDIVLDLILMDAFEDLESPPSSVVAVINNRWLSQGFKETALTTAVWSVIKSKRRKLENSQGFLSHFYSISEQVTPILVWGFLGPDKDLKDMCILFKENVVEYLQDIFSFQKCHFTSVEELASDILRMSKERMAFINEKLTP